MHETEAQIAELQALIDRSFAGANPHLVAISGPERRLTAKQVVAYLQGMKHVAFATASSKGEPRVAPLDSLFIGGRFVVGTDGTALRTRHMRRNQNVSLTHFDGDNLSIVVHGKASVFEKGDPEAMAIDEVWKEVYGGSAYSLGDDIVFIRVEPTHFFTFAQDPSKYPE